ncbi:MAG: beta-lactamase family protein [Lachnospiraceae bacterium]|nr:beta-lactamase family protein [Lachnospiraceae bacterium]
MNKRVLTGVLAVLLFIAVFAEAGAASYHEGDVEEYVMQQLAAANIPGVSLSIVTSQKEIYSVAFGDVKETSSDLQIGALTRTFTTLAIMQLVEDGGIKLEDRVLKYIKNPSQDIAYNTTIQELLSYTKPGEYEIGLAGILEAYNLDTEGESLPVNAKFNILGQVIEAVSGMDYATYIREKITVPLDMQSTYTIEEAGSTSDITRGCRNYFGLPLKDNTEYTEESYWLGVPSNGLVSNVKDMGKYMQMYLSAGGKVVSYNTMESIMGSGVYAGKSIFGTDAYYTMGWISTEVDGNQIYYCNGSVENYTSAMFIIPSMDIGVVILFNSADALTGQKYTNEIEAGAVSLVMGGTAKAVSSNSYLMEHGVADIFYFIAFVCSILPLLMMEVWVRWTKDKFSIIRMLADILLHIVIPTLLIFAASKYIAPWEIIRKAMPDLFFVSIVVIGLFYLGLVVKIAAYIIIFLKGGREERLEEEAGQYSNNYIDGDTDNSINGKEEDITGNKQTESKYKEKKSKKANKNTDEDREAREKKDKLVKRMKSIKEAGKNETGHKETENTETEENIKDEGEIAPETGEIIINTEETVSQTEGADREGTQEEETMPAGQENLAEGIKKAKVHGTETGTGAETEKTRPANHSGKTPRRFVVTNDSSATKHAKDRCLQENKRDKNVNRGSKGNTDNRRKINRNNNSANSSRGTREGSSFNRKNDKINKRKNSYNSTINRNSAVKDNNKK